VFKKRAKLCFKIGLENCMAQVKKVDNKAKIEKLNTKLRNFDYMIRSIHPDYL